MPLHAAPPIQDRRKFPRHDVPPRFHINLLHAHGAVTADSVNVSEGGLCLRLAEELEVRSLVRMQLTPASSLHESGQLGEGVVGRGLRPMRCTGRVTWIVQRLDLREGPPFLFDVGIQFVNPPQTLRQFMARQGISLSEMTHRVAQAKTLESAVIRGRQFVPRLERSPDHGRRWHLIVSVDGAPCFSHRFASEREALTAWTRFKREQARR